MAGLRAVNGGGEHSIRFLLSMMKRGGRAEPWRGNKPPTTPRPLGGQGPFPRETSFVWFAELVILHPCLKSFCCKIYMYTPLQYRQQASEWFGGAGTDADGPPPSPQGVVRTVWQLYSCLDCNYRWRIHVEQKTNWSFSSETLQCPPLMISLSLSLSTSLCRGYDAAEESLVFSIQYVSCEWLHSK
jgi:hypothetical protein